MRALHWVDTPKELERVCDELLQFESVAFDAEMDSYFVYHTKLCLVQISAGDQDILVDPLALEDLTPLNKVTRNPEIRKIFHAGENDIPYFRGRDVEFKNVFDTHVAAKILDLPSKGLGGLIELYFQVKLAKDQQRADWRLRPLPDEQVEYARQDTMYLNELADRLKVELKDEEALKEARQAFRCLEDFEVQKKDWDPDGWARIKGARELSGAQRGVLAALYAWRDEVAKERDLALFRVASNASLVSLARKRFSTPEQLRGWARGTTFKQQAERLIEVMEKGRRGGPVSFPERGKKFSGMTADQNAAYERLREWRNKESQRREVGPERVFSNRQLKRIVKDQPQDVTELGKTEGVEPWRVEEYGQRVLELLNGS